MKPIRRYRFTVEDREDAETYAVLSLKYTKQALKCAKLAHANHAAAYLRRALKSVEGAHRHALRMLPMLAILALTIACGSPSPTVPAVSVCHIETVPASDHCDTFFDAAGRPYLLCYTIPASTHQVCK